jgi:hypothetical protein
VILAEFHSDLVLKLKELRSPCYVVQPLPWGAFLEVTFKKELKLVLKTYMGSSLCKYNFLDDFIV